MTARLALLSWMGSLLAGGQTLDLQDEIRTFTGLTNTAVTLTGRAELRLTGAGDPMPGCVIHLNSVDSWLLLTEILPSQMASTFLNRVRVNGVSAVLDSNVRVVQHAQGVVVIPQGPDFSPLEVFDGRYFTGPAKRLYSYVAYNNARLGSMASAIGSFKLKRGYMATFAQEENGAGISRCYIAQDGDLEVGRLPSSLENAIRLVRVFPWRWVSKKGIAGNIEANLDVQWLYNWNLDRNSPLDWEYVPIRQTRWWPNLNQDWQTRGATHLLGYNEPDRPDQANLAVSDAISSWPDLLETGLRAGAPAVSDGGLNWLYDFINQADAAGLRVDFVPVHYYRCYANPGNPDGTATQFYNFLKGIYDVVQRPLWITEWNNGANWTGCADPSFAQQQAAMDAILNMLDNTPFVERYAIYNWVEDVRRVVWDDGSLTAAGVAYRDHRSPLAYRQEMPDAGTGTSARYSFDGDTHDGWGNGQDAMRVGAPRFMTGKHGQAIAFNGTSDYLQLSPRLADNTDWSFAGWIYWNGGGNWQRVFDFGADTSRYLFLSPKTGGGSLRFAINAGSGEQQLSGPALSVGVWTHVAITIAGNTGKLFVNGVVVDTHTGMTINPADVGTRFNFLGKSQFPADPLFSGRFDDFRFLSSALTEAQVADIVATPPPWFRATTIFKPDAAVQQSYSATLAGDAIGAGPLTFSKMDGPTWLSVAANGSLSGAPAPADGGVNTFLVRVTDLNGSLHTTTLRIAVPKVSAVITASEDDAEQSADGTMNLTSSDLELVNDSSGGAGDQIIGLRFTDLSIPSGAIITNASIQFTADESQSEATTLNVFAEASNDAVAFSSGANDLGRRARTSLSAPWQPAAWTRGQSSTIQRTSNLAALVQEIISRPGWLYGNAIVFIITGTGHRTADAADTPGGSPAHLTVDFVMPTPLHTFRTSVLGSADDAEESASGSVNLTSTDLELVNDDGGGAGDQTLGMRFEKVNLPAGSVIASAYLQFFADETQNDPSSLTIRAQAADDATRFATTTYNITDRVLTSAAVEWAPAAWMTVGEHGPLQRTPDLSALVREVIERPGWTSGNAMAFILSGTGHRTANSADKIGGSPVTLTVNYWPELPHGTYARWAASHPGHSSFTADLDGDGYDSLFEYALGLDPTVPNHGVTSLAFDSTWLHLTYTRPSAALDVSYEVTWTFYLGFPFWSRSGVTQEVLSDDGLRRTIRATLPGASGNQRLARLRVIH